MIWKPHVTVAAIIEENNRFLLVEEQTPNGIAFNQPAGHLEAGESFIRAIQREVQEETAFQFEPQHILGVQLWRKNPDSVTYLRIAFIGQVHSHNPQQALDAGIIATHWLSRDEMRRQTLRSPLVLKCVDDYLRGVRYPLELLHSLVDSE